MGEKKAKAAEVLVALGANGPVILM